MAIETWGIGKTDYSDEVSVGQFLLGIGIKATDTTVQILYHASDRGAYSPLPFEHAPVMPGCVAHAVDPTTGLSYPLTWPAGYSLRLISYWWYYSEPVIGSWHVSFYGLTGTMDRFFFGEWGSKTKAQWYEHDVQSFDTRFFDPNSQYPFSFDIRARNVGDRPLSCEVDVIGILRAVSTKPLPNVKTCKCKFCGFEKEVAWETQKMVCDRCGMTNLYYVMRKPVASEKGPLEAKD